MPPIFDWWRFARRHGAAPSNPGDALADTPGGDAGAGRTAGEGAGNRGGTMLELLQRIFGRESPSKDIAKERLRMVLVHDRATVAPQVWDALKVDLIRVISSYLDIDEATMEVQLQRENDAVALVANIPVRRVKRSAPGEEGGTAAIQA